MTEPLNDVALDIIRANLITDCYGQFTRTVRGLVATIDRDRERIAELDRQLAETQSCLAMTEALEEHEDQCWNCKPGNLCMGYYALYGEMCRHRTMVRRYYLARTKEVKDA